MASKKQRVRRPVPSRTDPDRRWRGVFGTPKTQPENGNSRASAGPDSQAANGARAASYEAVNNAYRVIDEYLRQGQRMAEQFWLPSGGGTGPMGSMQDAGRVFERFLRSAGDMGAAWLEMMSRWSSPTERDDAPAGKASPFTAGKQAPGHQARADPQGSSGASGLSVSVESSRKFQIWVDLHGQGQRTDLELRELTALDRSVPAITDIRLEAGSAEGQLTIRVRVPEGQPAGVYNGLLIGRGNHRPGGTVSLSLE
jgi:hypothetical protein